MVCGGLLAGLIRPMLDSKGKERRSLLPGLIPESLCAAGVCCWSGLLWEWLLPAAQKGNGNQSYKAGEKAADLKDYDAAVDYYGKALAADPHNPFYRIKLNDARFEAGQMHLHQGLKLRDKGDLQGAISEFQRAQILDPSSTIADQELKHTVDMLAERARERATKRTANDGKWRADIGFRAPGVEAAIARAD